VDVPVSLQEVVDHIWKLVGLGLASALGIWGVRRRMSSDALAVRKDRLEQSWLEQLQVEREAALQRERESAVEARARERATWDLHLQDARQLADLMMRDAVKTERIERLEREVTLLRKLLIEARPDLSNLVDTGFGDLFDYPPSPPARRVLPGPSPPPRK
jgi:hypothetical protein